MQEKKTVLIIDDDKSIGELLYALLELGGFKVCWCDNGLTALELSKQKSFHVIITDYQMKGMNGLFVASVFRKQFPDSLIIGISAEHRQTDFLKAGADAFFKKPFFFKDLIKLIEEKLLE